MSRINDFLKENYYALIICILRPVTIEQSFMMMDGSVSTTKNKSITKDDVADMITLKETGLTYQAIGDMYGLSASATFLRIKRLKGECK